MREQCCDLCLLNSYGDFMANEKGNLAPASVGGRTDTTAVLDRINVNGVDYVRAEGQLADRVSIYGMYDMHLFHPIEGATVAQVIANWRAHNRKPRPAMVGDRKVDDMGPSSLCPIIVLQGKTELRRVGPMVFQRGDDRAACDEVALEAWRTAALSDPDIQRLLDARDIG
jgi:hypothetical protein